MLLLFKVSRLTFDSHRHLQHPLFGYLPDGERLTRIAQSPNFANGIFRNQIDSPLHTTDQSVQARAHGLGDGGEGRRRIAAHAERNAAVKQGSQQPRLGSDTSMDASLLS